MFSKKLACLVALLFSLSALAQTMEGKNLVKLNLSSLAFKGFNVQYERQVSEKITVALGYGLIPFSKIPYNYVDITDYNLGTSIFTPEVRYYFGKKGAFHGFYLAPYARISRYKIEGPIVYSNTTGSKDNAVFTGKLKSITGGIMAGSSWQLSARFYLDWWIAGGSFGRESGKFTAPVQLSPEDQISLKRKLDSISLLGITLESEVNNKGAIVTTTGSMIGVRGLGINFGIRF